MAKVDQEAPRSRSYGEQWQKALRLQSVRKALPAGHGQSQETQALPNRQLGLTVDTQHLGSVSDGVQKKRAYDIVNVAYYSPQPQQTDAERQPLKRLEPSTHALVRGGNSRVRESQKQGFDILRQKELTALPIGNVVATREEIDKRLMSENLPAIPDAEYPALIKGDIDPVAINQGMKALQPLNEKTVAKREAESLAIISTKSAQRRFVHLTTRGRLYCSLARVASVPMLCGLI